MLREAQALPFCSGLRAVPLLWSERAGLVNVGTHALLPMNSSSYLPSCQASSPFRVNFSALEAAGQFTLLPELYKNTSFEVLGEAVKGKTWWRIKSGVGFRYSSLPGSLLRNRLFSLHLNLSGSVTSHIVCSFELWFQPQPPCVLFPQRNYFSPRGIVRTQSSSHLVAGISFEGPSLWRLPRPSLQEW